MLSYRHGFHAGNSADVFKHCVLLQLIHALQQKPKGFCYFDSHAGAGIYDLSAEFAQKKGEYRTGVGFLLQQLSHSDGHPAVLKYIEAVKALNEGPQLRRYPGSPVLAHGLLREQDRMILCELQQQEHRRLQALYSNDRRVAVHRRDAYEAIPALLPPQQKRGLVMIDPPYELKTEGAQLQQVLKVALQRFISGVYAIWYPLIEGRSLIAKITPQTLPASCEMLDLRWQFPAPAVLGRMNGCGMLLINPPWAAREILLSVPDTLDDIWA